MTTTSTYRKKPVVIEAMRWTGGARAATSVINWILAGDGIASYDDPDGNGGGLLRINTLEGTMRANPGDWIIRGVKGEFYPCKPDIFAATYDPTDESQA